MQKLDGSAYIEVIEPPPVVLLSTLYGEVANVFRRNPGEDGRQLPSCPTCPEARQW
jgi:hypothetical protein